VKPAVRYGFAGDQSSFNVAYTFTFRHNDKQVSGWAQDNYTHTFDIDYAHAFNPNSHLFLGDSFVIGQEPDLLQDPVSTQPITGNNIRNFADASLVQDLTDLFGLGLGYHNSYYNYAEDGVGVDGFGNVYPSNSGLYDRMEQTLRLDTRWKLTPTSTGIIGYNFVVSSYLGDEYIAGNLAVPSSLVYSDERDARSHIFYVGGEQAISSTMSGALKVGAQFTDYYNDPSGESQWSPYLQASLNYAYETRTTFALGLQYSRTAANTAGGAGVQYARDSETGTVYGNVRHELAKKLFITGNISAQHSKYNAPGWTYDGESFWFLQAGVDLTYEFTPNLSANAGYYYDDMNSDLPGQSYNRNRVYLGLTAGF